MYKEFMLLGVRASENDSQVKPILGQAGRWNFFEPFDNEGKVYGFICIWLAIN